MYLEGEDMNPQKSLTKHILNREAIPQGHQIKGSMVKAQYQIETHKNIEIIKHNGKKKALVHAANYPQLELDLDFLPAASESYHISPDPKDYIIVSKALVERKNKYYLKMLEKK